MRQSLILATLLLAACGSAPKPRESVRIATFNASLFRPAYGDLVRELEGDSTAARGVAAIVQRLRPDVLLLNEVDRDDALRAADLLRTRYLANPQGKDAGIDYPYLFAAEVNTGEPSGLDLDGDGQPNGPGDAWGFGAHRGQYGMLLLSRFPIDTANARTFRKLRWVTMPGNAIPDGFWPATTRDALRLSSKSHWDVPITLPDKRVVHVLASHPTPPVFDGPEDRNGRRNRDEIVFWVDYLTPDRSGWIVDDNGKSGGLAANAHFVVVGDLNCDPLDGDSRDAPVQRLLDHPRVDPRCVPTSDGGVEAAARQAGANTNHRGSPGADTGDFKDEPGPGNLRLDYVLPSRTLGVKGCGVFWPKSNSPDVGMIRVSDHRMVWVDLL